MLEVKKSDSIQITVITLFYKLSTIVRLCVFAYENRIIITSKVNI